MKRTSAFAELASWVSPASLVGRLLAPATLAVARCEAVFWESNALALVDLTFDDGLRTATLPAIGVDLLRLSNRSGSCLWWPHWIETAGLREAAEAVEDVVTPWLRTLVRGRLIAGESIQVFRPSPAFDAARARGDLGAAPLATALTGIAPFVYALRFVRDRTVELRCAHAARGAAVLRDLAASIGCSDDRAACAWFGVEPARLAADADILVTDDAPPDSSAQAHETVLVRSVEGPLGAPWRTVPIPHPVPLDLPFTFDEADAPVVGWFAVRSTDRAERVRRSVSPVVRVRESTGRIAFLMRPDARLAPDADVDDAEEVAGALQSIGIDAAICTTDADVAAFSPDLIHVFAAHDDDRWHGAAARLRALRVPYVVTLEPIGPYAAWEEQALSLLANAIDDDDRERYTEYFIRKGLALPPGSAPLAIAPETSARNDAEVAALLAGANVVFSANDADGLRRRFGLSAMLPIEIVGAMLPAEPEEEDVSALVPSEPFVFAHGPLLLRNHQISLAMAAGRPAVPIVVAGPASDVLYASRIARRAARGTLLIADPSPGVVAALYRRAAAFVEPSLHPAGSLRVLRAIACGALPIVPSASPLAPLIAPEGPRYDSLRFDEIRPAIDRAVRDPERSQKAAALAARVAPLLDSERTFRTILAGYARAAQTAAR